MKDQPVTYPRLYWLCSVLAVLFLTGLTPNADAQMVRTGLPFSTINDSFYERIGIDFGFSLKGSQRRPLGDNARGVFGLGLGGNLRPDITFSQGSINSALPIFGGYDPGTDATFGYRIQNSRGGYHLGLRLGKGSTRSITNTTPVIMTRNGVPGSLFNGTLQPFVMGIVPVVGNGSYENGFSMLPNLGSIQYTNPLELKLRQLHLDRQNGLSKQTNTMLPNAIPTQNRKPPGASSSTAQQGDLSVNEIERIKQIEDQRKVQELQSKVNQLILKSRNAVANGKHGAARSYLRTAIRYATGNQKIELQAQLQNLIDEN
ncbi:MAG: hypothetical protein VX438_15300 [Planctomycetota bacterium]|nr:hypothetical protein [Planctomycetota bacterium]